MLGLAVGLLIGAIFVHGFLSHLRAERDKESDRYGAEHYRRLDALRAHNARAALRSEAQANAALAAQVDQAMRRRA